MKEKNPNSFLNVVAAIFLLGFIVFVLKELQAIFLPLFIAIIISFIFFPLYTYLEKKKFPSAVSIIIIVLIIVIVSNIASVFIVTSVNTFTSEFPKYEEKFLAMYNDVVVKLNLSENERQSLENTFDFKKLISNGTLTSTVTGIFTSITGILGDYLLIIFYVIFILSEAESLQSRISAAFSDEKEKHLNKILNDIFTGVKGYIAGKTLLSLIQAVILGTFLWICGVDFFVIWGFMFFLSDFIPNIGSMIVTILVGILALLQFGSLTMPIIIVTVLIVIQNLKGNILEPRIFGQRLDLSPLLLFFSLIFWGYIWGIMGMILSVPIMSMVKIILMNIPGTKTAAILMSNNPRPQKDPAKNSKIKNI